MSTDYLRVPAIEVRQGPNRRLYTFAVDGKQLPKFTTISRIHRDKESEVGGYQRPEVISHIAAIRRYLESEDPLVPNALVVAFNDQVKFEAAAVESDVDYAMPGTLVIPIDAEVPDEDKPGWIVDGQQRSAALREADLEQFPISVVSFIASSDAEQRAQFILVNATKPLPKSLIQKAGFTNCRFYLQGSNLLTATKYKGFDPEVNGGVDYGNYPQSRTYIIGVNITY